MTDEYTPEASYTQYSEDAAYQPITTGESKEPLIHQQYTPPVNGFQPNPNHQYQPPPMNNQPYPQQYQPQYYPTTPNYNAPQDDSKNAEQSAMLLFIIAFFFGGIWLWAINWFVHKDSKSPGARKWAKISGIFALILLVGGIGTAGLSIGASIIFAVVRVVISVIASKKK